MEYRITGIFCGCLIFAEFCGSIEIAEIKNRKIFQSRYNYEVMSEVSVQSRISCLCLSGIVVELSVLCGIHKCTQLYDVHLDMKLSFKWHTVFEI